MGKRNWVVLLLLLCTVLAGCGAKGPKEKDAFTFDYKTDEATVKFYLKSDSIDMLLSSSPFYMGAQPYPTPGAREYCEVRAKKVDEIIAEADKLVGITEKTKPGMEKLREVYTNYLTTLRANDPKAEEFIAASLGDLIRHQTKEAIAEATYKSMDTSSENAFAKTYMQYFEVTKGVELGMLYVQDAENLVCSAAGVLMVEGKTKNAKIKKANDRLEKEMGAFDSIKGNLCDIIGSAGKIDCGFRQLQTGDYYFARDAVKFMRDNIPGLKEKMKGVKPNDQLNAEDIAFINSNLKSYENLASEMQKYLDSMDKSKLVNVSSVPNSILPAAYAEGEVSDNANAYKAVTTPAAKPEGWTFKGVLSSGWEATKTVVHGVQSGVGGIVDLAGLTVRNPTRAVLGVYYGSSWKDTWEDLKTNAQEVKDNWRLNRSGSDTMRTAYEGFKAAEDAADKGVSDLVATKADKGWISWGAGKVAGATVGFFTGMGKGITLIANRQATTSDYAVGAAEIAMSATGGSKLVLKGTQLPGLLKGLSKGLWVGGKQLVNFTERAISRSSRSEIRGLIQSVMKGSVNVAPQIANLTEQVLAEQATLTALRLTGKQLGQQMMTLIKEGAKAGAQNTLSTWRQSLYEFTKKQFTFNMTGVRKALVTAMGENAKGYVDSVIGQLADDVVKNLVDEALRGCPEPEEMAGKWTGTTTFTVINVPPPAEAKKEGCNFDLGAILKALKGKALPTTLTLNGKGSGTLILTVNGKSGNPTTGSYTYDRASGAFSFSCGQKGMTVSYKGKAIRAEDNYDLSGNAHISFGATGQQIAYMGGNWKVSKK